MISSSRRFRVLSAQFQKCAVLPPPSSQRRTYSFSLELDYSHLEAKTTTASRKAFQRRTEVCQIAKTKLSSEESVMSLPPPRLVLFFDINKTLIMLDPIQGKDLRNVINDIIAENVYGTVDDKNQWIWNGQEPGHAMQGTSVISYANFLRERFNGKASIEEMRANKELRKMLRRHFLDEGNPGHRFKTYADDLAQSMLLPTEVVGSEAAIACGLTGPTRFIIPAFFNLLLHLEEKGREFNVVFRTFGDDIDRVVQEYNAFCSGSHPSYPHVKMDGSNGTLDRRLNLVEGHVDEQSEPVYYHGAIVRCHNDFAIAMGTLDQVSAEQQRAGKPSYVAAAEVREYYAGKGIQLIEGLDNVHKAVQKMLKAHPTLAFRDDYYHWWANNEVPEAGKLLTVDERNLGLVHPIFFDDNILDDNARICDARDIKQGHLSFEHARDLYLIRCEPLLAIQDPEYFIKLLEKAESKRRTFLSPSCTGSHCSGSSQ